MGFFRDKIAVVTGGGSGIGKALCEALARDGAIVTMADVNVDRIERVQEEITRSGGNATALALDVADHDAVTEMIQNALAQWGRVDFLFNNAGIAIGGEARDITSYGPERPGIEHTRGLCYSGLSNRSRAIFLLAPSGSKTWPFMTR